VSWELRTRQSWREGVVQGEYAPDAVLKVFLTAGHQHWLWSLVRATAS
jgi:hypothetical protein